ncbi:L,D-transpeptidase [Bacillus solimangrovi]|uniref:L,D-TPase catalytic domain-containing protein n=1 Tax=Bacillus solimangrovi TaxID=1305675 RepID=A0A1E5LB58_9BACI|nr:L,D-transpeptidase [Bacillus solimangrovi]OEH91320.1 hypothetical protein BFG57_05490 [Bacillus solimangrovi]
MDGKKAGVPDYFVKVGSGAYLSKYDPRFLEKYVRFFPHDGEKLYEYAQQLVSQGKRDMAKYYYGRAAKEGYFGRVSTPNSIIIKKEQEETKKQKGVTFLLWINFILLLLILLFIGHLFYTELLDGKMHAEPTVSMTNDRAEYDLIANSERETGRFPLALIALNEAIVNYEVYYHQYPNSIDQLTQPYPNNWISSIPTGVTYIVTEGGYELYWQGQEVSKLLPPIQLLYYQGSNILALNVGGDFLASYPVASGIEPLPFESSQITERVVQPNGGKGILGTRGLVLHEQYAIHGTNDPSSIGKNVSLGCLRMSNEQVEALYPYIPIGTPLIVRDEPFHEIEPFFSSLPFLNVMDLEHAHDTIFRWRQ